MTGAAAAASLYVGVDVQLARGCPLVAIDEEGRYVTSTWLEPSTGDAPHVHLAERLRGCVEALAAHHRARVSVGIDAPRQPLVRPRAHYWEGGARGRWRTRRPGDRGRGRHCEVVVAALGLARPQWTPLASTVPAWMALGFACFDVLAGGSGSAGAAGVADVDVHEVFPSASYRQFEARPARVELVLTGFARGAKDMLDAWCAAATVREVAQGRGWPAGGGDGLGAIVLPGPRVSPTSGVHRWPAEEGEA